MKNLFTIGFTKKNAERFFTLLEQNKIACLVDIRLNNNSQLAGFSKYPDIEFFLKRISNIKYIHDVNFAPTQEILTDYKNKLIDWEGYVIRFNQLMESRNIVKYIEINYNDIDGYCFLCTEDKPDFCHRRLVSEIIQNNFDKVNVIHLI